MMEPIIRYTTRYRQTQLITLSASEAGIGALKNMQEKLRFAGQELQRMEDESGIPLNEEQAEKVDAYFQASLRIKKILLQTCNNITDH